MKPPGNFSPLQAAACALVLFLRCGLPCSGQQPAALGTNLLKNANFENGMEGWVMQSAGGTATATLDQDQRHDGHPSVRIDNAGADGAYLSQAVTLKPATRYRMSAWIKAKKIIKISERIGDVGACIAMIPSPGGTMGVYDSKDWVHVAADFTTGAETDVKVGPELGNSFRMATGTAWYTDLSLVELAPNDKSDQQLSPFEMAGKPASIEDLFNKYRDSLGRVAVGRGSGSGFLARYETGNFLFTNAHVAAGAKGAPFKTVGGAQLKMGAASCAVAHDVFLVQTAGGGEPFEIMKGVDQNVTIGDEIVVLGNGEDAGEVDHIVGKIVGVGPNLVEIDAPFKPGNSGSPIVHLKSGKVIGVATYIVIRKYDPATRQSIKDPIIRRFGYRLDSIKSWQPVNWPAFLAQASEMETIDKLTTDLVAILDDAAKNSHPTRGAHINPVFKNRIDAWLDDRAKKHSPRDAATIDQDFLSFLKSTCQSDVAAAQRNLTYDYFQRGLPDRQIERNEISRFFDEMIPALPKEPTLPKGLILPKGN